MNKKNGPSLGHNKKSLLKSEVEHIDITSFDSRKIIESMKKMSFTSRDTAKAAEIPMILLEDGYTEKNVDEIYHNHLIKDFVGIEKIISIYL